MYIFNYLLIVGSQLNSSSDWQDDDELLSKVEEACKKIPSIGKWFSEGKSIEDLVNTLFSELKPAIPVKRNIEYFCPCSQKQFLDYIRHLPADQVLDLKKNGPDPLEILCHNCGSVYHIPTSDI